MTGSDLYHRIISFDYGDEKRRALMEKVWSITPWMVDAYTGRVSNERDIDIREWCRERIGDEAQPIHEMPGKWQRGGATIDGWTWFGFTNMADMDAFVAAWPTPEGVVKE